MRTLAQAESLGRLALVGTAALVPIVGGTAYALPDGVVKRAAAPVWEVLRSPLDGDDLPSHVVEASVAERRAQGAEYAFPATALPEVRARIGPSADESADLAGEPVEDASILAVYLVPSESDALDDGEPVGPGTPTDDDESAAGVGGKPEDEQPQDPGDDPGGSEGSDDGGDADTGGDPSSGGDPDGGEGSGDGGGSEPDQEGSGGDGEPGDDEPGGDDGQEPGGDGDDPQDGDEDGAEEDGDGPGDDDGGGSEDEDDCGDDEDGGPGEDRGHGNGNADSHGNGNAHGHDDGHGGGNDDHTHGLWGDDHDDHD